ncbi:MAG: ABC transporter ATP-binding protein [Rhodospirillaceae bacterium]|nr:ABC transporter ATP-binding protein [Rhodospirillaceae bacterium]
MDGPDITPILEIEDLCVSYFSRAGEIPAIVDFSLQLAPGESVGLVGESGCGKSTVAMAIMRYLGTNGDITGGRVRFRGRDMAVLNDSELRAIRGGQIAMVYQEPMSALNPSLTIGDQLCEVPLTHCGVTAAEARARAVQMLRDVHLPDPERVMGAYPHQISGGQQQRVVIAMALLGEPALLLLDEPTTALDVTVEAGIVELIAELSRKFGTALLYISHNLGLMLEVCDRIGVMYSGEIVEERETGALFVNPRHPYTQGLLGCIPLPHADKHARPLRAIPGQLPLPQDRPEGCNFGPRCASFRQEICGVRSIDMAEGVRCARWRDAVPPIAMPQSAYHLPDTPGETVLEVDQLRKYYAVRDTSLRALVSGQTVRYVKANEALSFDARVGETVAIVGESGCGKSTLARVLVGLETASGGTVRFQDSEIGGVTARDRTPAQRGALQMVFQNPNDTLNPSLSIGAQIGRVIRKFGIEREPAKVRARVQQLLEMVKLPAAFASRRPRQLSGGQKQRVAIARAFAGNPAAVIADEPISALDVSVAAAITELVMDIQREQKTSLVFISHDLSAVRYLADRVVVMYLGRVMEQGPTEAVFGPPYHPYTEALLSAVPVADPTVQKRRIVLEGAPPSPLEPPAGCPFASRCPRRIGAVCDEAVPDMQTLASGHRIACHLPREELEAVEPVIATKAAS